MNNLLSYLHTKLQHINRINESSFTQLLDKKKRQLLRYFFFLSGEILHVFVDKYLELYTRKCQLQLVNIWAQQRFYTKVVLMGINLGIVRFEKALHGCCHKDRAPQD